MRSWKTTLFGVLSVGSFVAGYFLPQHKDLFNGITSILIGGGLFAAKDYDKTGANNGRLLGKHGDQYNTYSDQAGDKESCNEGSFKESIIESKGPN